MTVAAHPPALPAPADGFCPRWPRKLVYWSPDQASVALREFWAELQTRGMTRNAARLAAYGCASGRFTHWHLGKGEAGS